MITRDSLVRKGQDMWCETMTSPQRMGAVMRGEKPDRVPVIPFIIGHTALVCGEPLARMYDDAAQSFRCQLLAQEMYGYDGGPLYGYASAGAWEFGGDVEMPYKKYSGAPVVTRTPIENEEDALNLKVPEDVSKVGAIPIALDMARIQARYGMPIFAHVGTPFAWTGSVIGTGLMMRWLIKKPDVVHSVLAKVTEFLIKLLTYYVDQFGVEHVTGFLGCHEESNNLISPRQFEAFALPYTQQVVARATELGIRSFFAHICGEQNKNLKLWQQVPFPKRSILSFGREVPLATAMELFPEQIIAGNVDPTLIQEGKPEQVLAQAKECIETAMHHTGGYILMGGCDVPPQSPPVNVFQLVKAAREYGRY
jgi:uroporphyrinogen decarboxylase